MVDEGAGSDSNKQTWFVKLDAVNLLENLGNKKVKSEDNKLLIFKSNEEHTGSTCTDLDRRILINVIYIEKK